MNQSPVSHGHVASRNEQRALSKLPKPCMTGSMASSMHSYLQSASFLKAFCNAACAAMVSSQSSAFPSVLQVLRSKGFVWLAGNDVMAGEWSQAGSIMRLSCGGPWFAALPRQAWNIVKVGIKPARQLCWRRRHIKSCKCCHTPGKAAGRRSHDAATRQSAARSMTFTQCRQMDTLCSPCLGHPE